jgi:transcriptional regulator with XRE-family HTH domain
VAIHRNTTVTEAIGKKIEELRKARGLEIEDISEMTGFTPTNIRSIEKGKESRISTLAEIAFAIGIQPHELLNVTFKIKPRFKLSAKRKEKTRLTERINQLIKSNYFREPKYAKDVLLILTKEHKIKTTSPSISAILLRRVKEGKLQIKRIGRQNQYSITSK